MDNLLLNITSGLWIVLGVLFYFCLNSEYPYLTIKW